VAPILEALILALKYSNSSILVCSVKIAARFLGTEEIVTAILESLLMARRNRGYITKHTYEAPRYSGVSRTATGNYRAELWLQAKHISLGVYSTHDEAAEMFNYASREMHAAYRHVTQRVIASYPPTPPPPIAPTLTAPRRRRLVPA
jgi:hypothetical protein